MTHSSHSISMQWQPSIHLKKRFPHSTIMFFHLYGVMDKRPHYVLWTHLHGHYHHSLWYKLFHTQDWNNNFSCDSHKTKSTFWKYLHAWHGPTKDSKLCNDVQKAQKRLDQLHLAPFQQKTKENKIDFLPNKEFSFGSLMFVTTKATMNLWHLIVHLKKINSSTIGITKKTQVFGNPWQNAAPMYFPLHFQLIFFIYLPKQTCDMNNFFGLS